MKLSAGRLNDIYHSNWTQQMSQALSVELEVPDDLARLRFPRALDNRLQELLDRKDVGTGLSEQERLEAEGLVELAEFLTLLRLRAERLGNGNVTQ